MKLNDQEKSIKKEEESWVKNQNWLTYQQAMGCSKFYEQRGQESN